MLIAKRYLDEIRDICNGKYADGATVQECIANAHWCQPSSSQPGGLFAYCAADDTLRAGGYDAAPTGACGCLTQIRRNDEDNVVVNRACRPIRGLTAAIARDPQIAEHPDRIAPGHLRELHYPLSTAHKKELRDALLPYAKWQTKLRRYFNDTPEDKLKLVEVKC